MYFKQLLTIYNNLKKTGRSLFELNAEEEAIIRTIAESRSKTAFDAQTIMQLVYREEYPVPLPDWPEMINPEYIQQFSIYFKNNATTPDNYSFSKAYPNPTTNTIYLNYVLPTTDDEATFYLFDINGQIVKKVQMSGNGKLSCYIPELKTGLYYYHTVLNEQVVQKDKLIVIK